MFLNEVFSISILCLLELFAYSEGFWFEQTPLSVNPGPLVVATKGEVWPKPQFKITNENFFIIRPNAFQFKVVGQTCEILDKALNRYKHDLKVHERMRRFTKLSTRNDTERKKLIDESTCRGYLSELSVDLKSSCEQLPYLDMDEHYELRINTEDFPGEAHLIGASIWGILRGLETFSQLVYMSSDYRALLINSSSIMDFPRFSHRGLLIDTSRHFLPMRTIYLMMDAMAATKMNVLHWHMVDDQSFPFESKTFPQLSAKGAYASTHIYSQKDVQNVIRYAADRGIRVISEFDTPGHTRSWGQGHPEILTKCYNGNKPDGSLGPMNPIYPGAYDFMRKLLKEIVEVFPERYLHLGGDEVDFSCWENNPEIREYMEREGLTARQLEGIYVKQIINIAANLSANSIVWQEVFDDGVNLPNTTVIQIWKGKHEEELFKVTSKGYKALLSSCWYLDALSSGGNWIEFYKCDPHNFPGSEAERHRVIGGEACMWGEVVDVNNVLSRVWPRACAAAERLWSRSNSKDASSRLEEHTCRMNRRGIPAQPPNGPGFCPGLNFT